MTRGLGIPAMLFACLLLLGSQVSSQEVEVYNAPLLRDYLGVTLCVGGKVIILINHTVDSVERKTVVEHERIHARQVREHGSCADFAVKYRTDVLFRLGIELEAYCPEARARVPRMGVDGVTVALTQHLIESHGGLEHYNLVKFLVRNCLTHKVA